MPLRLVTGSNLFSSQPTPRGICFIQVELLRRRHAPQSLSSRPTASSNLFSSLPISTRPQNVQVEPRRRRHAPQSPAFRSTTSSNLFSSIPVPHRLHVQVKPRRRRHAPQNPSFRPKSLLATPLLATPLLVTAKFLGFECSYSDYWQKYPARRRDGRKNRRLGTVLERSVLCARYA